MNVDSPLAHSMSEELSPEECMEALEENKQLIEELLLRSTQQKRDIHKLQNGLSEMKGEVW